MTTFQTIAMAMQRATQVFERRPQNGLHRDTTAVARWNGGTRVVTHHENGTEIASDMPVELGGSGDRVSPGWLMRAGLSACTATAIAMTAAARGIDLTVLEVTADSRSDTRGLLGMADADGTAVFAGPRDLQVRVRIGARAATDEQLKSLVSDSYRRSPIACALQASYPDALLIEVIAI